MTIKLAVCVIHAAHIPERVVMMNRVRDLLGELPANVVAYHEETTRGKYVAWHELSLRFFLDAAMLAGATHALTLQDDVIPCAQFWEILFAMLEGRPNEVICLDCAHPAARPILFDGAPGYTTPDGLIGIGHVAPMKIVEDFSHWRLHEVREHTIGRTSEDTLFALYCMHRGLPIFAPVPCPIDHDLGIPSTNEGYDDHWYRKPQVTMRELERLGPEERASVEGRVLDPKWWASEAPHVGRFYENAQDWLPLILPGDVHELVEKYALDRTPPKYARFWSRLAALDA